MAMERSDLITFDRCVWMRYGGKKMARSGVEAGQAVWVKRLVMPWLT
jgi:hypothetical protein